MRGGRAGLIVNVETSYISLAGVISAELKESHNINITEAGILRKLCEIESLVSPGTIRYAAQHPRSRKARALRALRVLVNSPRFVATADICLMYAWIRLATALCTNMTIVDVVIRFEERIDVYNPRMLRQLMRKLARELDEWLLVIIAGAGRVQKTEPVIHILVATVMPIHLLRELVRSVARRVLGRNVQVRLSPSQSIQHSINKVIYVMTHHTTYTPTHRTHNHQRTSNKTQPRIKENMRVCVHHNQSSCECRTSSFQIRENSDKPGSAENAGCSGSAGSEGLYL